MTEQRRKQERVVGRRYVVGMVISNTLTAAVLGIAGIAYTTWSNHKQDQLWCSTLVILDRPRVPRNPPPATDRAKQAAALDAALQKALHERRLSAGCDDK